MSFAREVKKELLGVDNLPCCAEAQIAGIFHSLAEVGISLKGMSITLKSPINSIIRHVIPFIKRKYGLEGELSYALENGLKKQKYYYLKYQGEINNLVSSYHLLPLDSFMVTDELFDNECCKNAFVRGCFIAKGSINDPKKSNYHLEIMFKKIETASLVLNILKENDVYASITNKKNQYLLYIKKSEEISKFLAYVGASEGVFEFENLRILRDYYNNVNRTINCDIANGNRSMQYCNRQKEAIEFLEKHNIVPKLSSRLQDAINLRKEYPDSSLAELSEFSSNVLGKEMSKSGISHCMREIMKVYEYYKKKDD
ncbi:MAG: DNA-binding protein WhiA [Bacilli bacterium]|nr:DNA-binding protein WhiA [Bacilli bacterium]